MYYLILTTKPFQMLWFIACKVYFLLHRSSHQLLSLQGCVIIAKASWLDSIRIQTLFCGDVSFKSFLNSIRCRNSLSIKLNLNRSQKLLQYINTVVVIIAKSDDWNIKTCDDDVLFNSH